MNSCSSSVRYQKHGVRLWFRGEENADLTLILPSNEARKAGLRTLYCQLFLYPGETDPGQSSRQTQLRRLVSPDAALRSAHENVRLDPVSLIAVFFATETYRETDTDACVWVLTPGLLNEKEGFGNCIYPIDADTTQEMLLPAFKHNHHNPELKNKILACSSTENNLRMYSQYSNFTVHNSLNVWKTSAMKYAV